MRFQRSVVVAVALLAAAAAARAEAPHVYAITGARIVPVAGAPIEQGTVVIRDGRIEAVGAAVEAPADAWVIDGAGLTVYPGLIDMGHAESVDVPVIPEPRDARTREQVERWKRDVILRPELEAAAHLRVDAPALGRLAAAGITAVLATPSGQVFRGQSALVNVRAPEEDPQIGDVAPPRAGQVVVRTPVALHVSFPNRPRGDAYPNSLMGVIAFVRQAFLDARHYQLAWEHYRRAPDRADRPVHDPALEALQAAVDGQLPVAFEAAAPREIRRALGLAAELKLRPIITGGLGAGDAADELAAADAAVIYSLDYPERPPSLAPDADEPLRVLRERAGAPKVPAALAAAGVPVAFSSGDLDEPGHFLRNAARAVAAGLSPEAALRALTLDAARIAGAGDRLGSIEAGKVANLIATDGDLFDEKTTVRHVFIDGRLVAIEPAETTDR